MINLSQAQVESKMSEVLCIRYTDLELEKNICTELLQWESVHKDLYVQAFALTYLGDYYIGINQGKECISHLQKARDISIAQDYNDLLLRIYSLLGFYYGSIADDQSSLEYYIEGITICRSIKDATNEGLILNNIGYNLQRHKGYEQALKFYKEAYGLFQTCEEPSPILGLLFNNLATVSILLNNLEEAKQYILKCEETTYGTDQYDILRSQSWCQYYVATNESDKAMKWADHILSHEEELSEDKHYAFDIYSILFDSMLQIQNSPYAHRFLKLMEKYVTANSSQQQQELEIQRMLYLDTFEEDETILAQAYKQYATRIQTLDTIRNNITTSGLKDAVRFLHVSKQREQLKHEKSDLAKQVNIDELTKVYTRYYLETLMNTYEKQTYETLGFIMIDVDCLKEYNDTYGHLLGDDALRSVGSLLNRFKLDNIFPCRFGGDEFVCLCIDCKDKDIVNYIESIRNELNKKHILHKSSRCSNQLTLSIGYSNETNGIAMHTMFELADQALYKAKVQGRNSYTKQSI